MEQNNSGGDLTTYRIEIRFPDNRFESLVLRVRDAGFAETNYRSALKRPEYKGATVVFIQEQVIKIQEVA